MWAHLKHQNKSTLRINKAERSNLFFKNYFSLVCLLLIYSQLFALPKKKSPCSIHESIVNAHYFRWNLILSSDAYPRTVWPFQQPPPWHPWCTCAFCLLFLAPLEPRSPRSDRVTLSIHQSVHLFICFFKSQFYIKFSLIFFCFCFVGWTSFFFLIFTSPLHHL